MSVVVVAVSSCASVVIPPEHLEREQASMRAAEELGAEQVPDAQLHLQLAKDQTASAKQLAAAGDDRANLMLSRADADAELAVGMAKLSTVHRQALAAAEDLQEVQSRSSSNPISTSPMKGTP